MGENMGEFIDFADITNQMYRQEMNRVHGFNLMLVGLSGVGKSTLVTSLFKGLIKPEKSIPGAKLNEYCDIIEDHGVKLRLRCIETSKYAAHSPDDYKKYLEDKLRDYFIAQRRQSSWNILDTRVHCCLYMIPPNGEMELKKEDVDCMLQLHDKVNLIPLIAKADTLNSYEVSKFKENIMTSLELHGIQYFKFQHDDKEDEERSRAVKSANERFPFAIIATDEVTIENNRKRWIRKTLCGQIDIADAQMCDFVALSNLVIRHCMLDLIDSTHVRHYAKFRSELLEDAQKRGYRNLRDLGLEPHEIKRIEYDANGKEGGDTLNHYNRLRADMERELQGLRNRLHVWKAQVK